MTQTEIKQLSKILELIEIYGYSLREAETMVNRDGEIKTEYLLDFFYATQRNLNTAEA